MGSAQVTRSATLCAASICCGGPPNCKIASSRNSSSVLYDLYDHRQDPARHGGSLLRLQLQPPHILGSTGVEGPASLDSNISSRL